MGLRFQKVMSVSAPGWRKVGEFSQVLHSPAAIHDWTCMSFWISPWLRLMTVSKFPDSKIIPRRIKTMLLQPVKNEMPFVTRILALVASKPPGPMTWSVRGPLVE